jgi:anti-sigma regulatory factor (Ser/Thr protein kinase)
MAAIRSARTMLPALPTSAASARRFLRDRLKDWGYPVVTSGTPELLASELVTNAIVHAGQAIVEFQLTLTGRRLRALVGDTNPRPPHIARGEPEDESGRGLCILDRLAAAWGVEARPIGKAVWFEVDLDE